MKMIALGALLASTIALSACGGDKAATTNTARNTSTAAAPASNAAAPASGNAAAPVAGEAGDRTNQNFTLNNRSQAVISHVYVSPVSDEQWGEDVMGQDVLNAGESVEISFPRAESECNWDIRVTINGDQNQEIRNVNLCETTEVNYQ